MKNSNNKYSAVLTIALLILGFSASVFGQDKTQIYQGCSGSPYIYSNDNTYIWKILTGDWHKQIDRIETGDSGRFAFTFRPNRGRNNSRSAGQHGIIRAEMIKFTTFMFGMDKESFDANPKLTRINPRGISS